jgi:hypothetical protein
MIITVSIGLSCFLWELQYMRLPPELAIQEDMKIQPVSAHENLANPDPAAPGEKPSLEFPDDPIQ